MISPNLVIHRLLLVGFTLMLDEADPADFKNNTNCLTGSGTVSGYPFRRDVTTDLRHTIGRHVTQTKGKTMIRFIATTSLALAGAVVVGVFFLAVLLLPRQRGAAPDIIPSR
jgi:hypothetical protein